MHLRPHHLLCIQKYTGHGYDAAFTAHMTAVSLHLRNAPQTVVTLQNGADDLCKQCPHLESGVCDAEQKTGALDRAVMRTLSVQYGTSAAWYAFAQDANAKILQTNAFHEICACCQWYDLCRKTEVPSL